MGRFAILRGLALGLALAVAALSAASARGQDVVVMPYVQPGDGRFLQGADVKVISWFTDQKPGQFSVEYQLPFGPVQKIMPVRTAIDFDAYVPPPPKKSEQTKAEKEKADKEKADKERVDKEKSAGDRKLEARKKTEEEEPAAVKEPKILPPLETEQHYYKYSATLERLPFNCEVHYRVMLGSRVVREASFRTRSTADREVRCVLVGDMAQGRKQQKEIAYRISEQRPDFLMALGDIVYPTGRMNQYMAYFWNTYNNVDHASPSNGAPLMASVPFYPVLGNHDVAARLPAVPDAFAAYYIYSPPKGGPGDGPWATGLGKKAEVVEKFRSLTRDAYPYIDAYSFDNGPAHFVVLNDNKGMAIEDPTFIKWLRGDLMATRAKWKIVCFHIPPFHSSKTHYPEQQMRPLQPLFEECGVDMTFGGHVHNYQRTVPLKFAPDPAKDRRTQVDGQFTLDREFDGIKHTRPSGVIHIVAGGGGASLYGPGLDKTSEFLHEKYGENYADFTARMVASEHSFVVLDLTPDRIEYRAIAMNGHEIDRICITK